MRRHQRETSGTKHVLKFVFCGNLPSRKKLVILGFIAETTVEKHEKKNFMPVSPFVTALNS